MSSRFNLAQGPLNLHTSVFTPTIELLGSEEQKTKYLNDAYALKIIGSYSQTELAHGSDVQALQTTATYDA